jgi:ribose transport system permease protein
MSALRQTLSRLLSHYGMALVLVVLCGYYSLVTRTEMQPAGADAARQVAGKVRGHVLIVTRATDDSRAFAEALEAALRERGATVSRVEGEPRDARMVLEKLAEAGKPLDFIATTPECAQWTLWQNISSRFASLGQPRVITPTSSRWPTFLTRQNLLNVGNQISVVAILAVGMTVVIITAGIDLSVGSLIALSAVVATVLIKELGGAVQASGGSLFLCSIAAVALCSAVGLFSGVMVAVFKVPPFITTLAVMQVASGLAFIIAKGGSIYEVPDRFTWLGRATGPFEIPVAVLVMVALYAMTHIIMAHTVLGRRIYAVGGNPEAARLSGVNVAAVLVFAYAFSGATAGFGGVLQASQLKSGAPTYGAMYELYAVAAVVVGGTSLAGGEGRIFGTLIGALIIAVIQNGMNLTGVESYQQKVVLGIVILAAVLLDLLKRRDWRRWFRLFNRTSRELRV